MPDRSRHFDECFDFVNHEKTPLNVEFSIKARSML
jgi:hypothetical protein